MTNNSRGVTVECIECAWQGDEHLTDTRCCPECGGECMELVDIYGPNGLHPDPEWKQSNTPISGGTPAA
jgi:hypothetical protein